MTARRDTALILLGWVAATVGIVLAAVLFGCGHGCPAAQHPGSQPDQSPTCPRR